MTGRVALAIVLSLVAALLYALSNVLEQHEAEQIPDELSMRVSLLRRLIARPLWVLGFVSDVGGYIVSAWALAFGAVLFVQPLLSVGLLMSLLLSSVLYKKRLPRRAWYAAFLLCGGLALFLYEVSPTGGRDQVPATRMVVWGPVFVLSIAGCMIAARQLRKGPRAALLGASAAIAFAASAVFTKSLVHYLGEGVFAWVPHWEPYALAVSSLFGLVLVQSAFQAGNLPAAVGGIEATQPIAAVIVGVGLLDEHVATDTPGNVFAVVVAMVALFVGILVLANAEGGRPAPSTDVRAEIPLGEDLVDLVAAEDAVEAEEVARSQHTPGDPAAPRRFR